VRNIKTTKPIVCELLAILDALKLMKKKKFKKAIIITDQKAWTSSFSIDLKAYEGPVKQYINELNQVWNQYKGKVEIKFIGDLKEGKNNPLYKKAHDLSQEHRACVIERLKF
jgi:ribonuclease HI